MQQFRALCQRYAGWIVVLLVLLLCQRWWIARNKPERLLELPPGASLRSLHKGILTLEKWTTPSLQFNTTHIRRPGSNRLIPITTTTTQTPATLALFTMPATGGPLHSLPPESSAETSNSLFTAGSDTYRVEYHKTMRELIGIPPGYGSRSGSSGTGIGSSGPPPPPKPPFHPVTNREEAEEVTATLHRVSASGVPTTEALTCPMGYVAKSHISSSPGLRTFLEPKITVAGNAVYWIKGFPNELTYHESSNGQVVGKTIYKYRSAVMAMPLHGGKARKLLDNVPEDAMLLASEDGVLCRISKERHLEWLHIHPNGTSQQVLANFQSYPYYDSQNLLVGSHHLYWAQPDERSHDVKIMQADGNGSKQRVLYTASHTSAVEMRQWREQIYFRVVDAPPPGQSPSVHKSTLYRVNLALPSGVERLCSLPDNADQMLFDEDYAYFLAQEEKTGFIDNFRAASSPETRSVLYRYRLPVPSI